MKAKPNKIPKKIPKKIQTRCPLRKWQNQSISANGSQCDPCDPLSDIAPWLKSMDFWKAQSNGLLERLTHFKEKWLIVPFHPPSESTPIPNDCRSLPPKTLPRPHLPL